MNERVKDWQAYYDQCAAMPDEMFQSSRFDIAPFQYRAVIEDIRRKLPLAPEDVLLDVGCCNGQIDRELAGSVKKLVGVDLSEASLKLARQNNSHHPNAEFHWADAGELPYPDNSFDKILMYGVSMHGDLAWLTRVIREFIRVTRNGGKILIGDNISAVKWEAFLQSRGLGDTIRAYTALNPENESFILPKVLFYHARKILEMKLRRRLIPEIRQTLAPVDEPYENSTFEEDQLLALVRDLGQQGTTRIQNFRLPYARFRFDLLITVSK